MQNGHNISIISNTNGPWGWGIYNNLGQRLAGHEAISAPRFDFCPDISARGCYYLMIFSAAGQEWHNIYFE